MEISTDTDGTVYVRWPPGGHWTALTEDGSVTEYPLGGTVAWIEADDRGDYSDGIEAGIAAAEHRRQAALLAKRTAAKAKAATK